MISSITNACYRDLKGQVHLPHWLTPAGSPTVTNLSAHPKIGVLDANRSLMLSDTLMDIHVNSEPQNDCHLHQNI